MECGVFQYEELKKWSMLFQLKNENVVITIYPIVICSPLFDRITRLIYKANTENEIYRSTDKILCERYEYSTILMNNKELIDSQNPNTCIVNNKGNDLKVMVNSTNVIEKFIVSKLV